MIMTITFLASLISTKYSYDQTALIIVLCVFNMIRLSSFVSAVVTCIV